MKSMTSLLTAMNSSMDKFERSRDESDSASVHAVYAVPPEPSTSRATTDDGPARCCQGAAVPDGYSDVSKEVRACVASHHHSTPALFISTDNGSASRDYCQLSGRED